MRALAWRCALLLLAATAASSARISASSVHQIRGIDGLALAYDFILEARFDQVEAELRRACPPAPTEACEVLGATSLWWQILLDPESRELDDEFSTAVDRAIASTEAWTERAPDDAEAWFYNGGAYAARVQWRVLRNEKLAAARDGKAIKVALERAIELDPTLEDAYFGVGMYKYYADVAPAAAKFLRFLMLLPGGDRKEGLDQMLRARTRGRLLQGEADYQLHATDRLACRTPVVRLDLIFVLGLNQPERFRGTAAHDRRSVGQRLDQRSGGRGLANQSQSERGHPANVRIVVGQCGDERLNTSRKPDATDGERCATAHARFRISQQLREIGGQHRSRSRRGRRASTCS